MKRLMQGIRTWPGCFDLMTDAFYIEEDREHGRSRELTEIERTLLVLGAALVPWMVTVCILLS